MIELPEYPILPREDIVRCADASKNRMIGMLRQKVSIIVAMSINRTIGKDGKIPWRCKPDMKRFKEITTGHIVIMGRKTFESMGSKPLKNRVNIVVTSKPLSEQNIADGVLSATSVQDALFIARHSNLLEKDIFFIGGERIYAEALAVSNKIYLTLIGTMIDGDAKFPELPTNVNWTVNIVGEGFKGEDSDYNYSFLDMERKSND